jgi:hypothetical protein
MKDNYLPLIKTSLEPYVEKKDMQMYVADCSSPVLAGYDI